MSKNDKNSILDLAAAWEKAHPKRARGGVFAIAGFRYQFHCVLRDVVKSWIDDKLAVAPATEILSDILSQSGHKWTITQVKRTGTSGSLHKALDELWTIEGVALSDFPDLLGSLRYEVRCAEWELSDIQASIDRWTPDKSTGSDDSALHHFKKRVKPSWDPSPLDDLAAMLVRECHALNAFEWIDRWTSRLIDVSIGELKSEAFGKELYESLRQFKADAYPKLPTGIQAIEPKFAEPTLVIPGDHLVGEQPRLRHLEEGYFAPRNWQVDPATQAFLKWNESDPFGSDKQRRIPVYWIAGRSGSGKSILLLQLLARLSQCGIAPVLWLGNHRALLSDAMSWGVQATQYHAQPIIAIDDPFVPGEQGDAELHWNKTISQLEAIRDKGDSIPIIVACGPTEQATAFQLEYESDVLVHQWILDEAADLDHLQSLAKWFEQRTGGKPPDVGGGEVLMVQRFFEWRTGEPLTQFSQRFRERVEALDMSGQLTQLVAELLAVNRLYCGLPGNSLDRLDDQNQDALEHLKDDHHIVIDQDSGRKGIWLAHPHLADALFGGWFGRTNKHQKTGALRDGILTCFKFGTTPTEKTSALWAISKAWIAKDDLAHRIDRDNTAKILEQVFPFFLNEHEQLSFSQYPIWIRLSCMIPNIRLTPRPVDMVIGEIETGSTDETGFRLTCHILLSHLNELSENRCEILRVIRATLDDTPEWFEWPHVAANLTRASCDPSDGRRLLNWVASHSSSRDAPKLLSTAMAITECEAESQELTSSIALSAGNAPEWAILLEFLLKQTDKYIESIVYWAERNVLKPFALFVLRELLERDYPSALELARKWVSHFPNSNRANFLIEPLCERYEAGDFERKAAESWVSPSLPGADRLIEWLLVLDPTPRLIQLARDWMSQHHNAVGWVFVLQKLIEVMPLGKERDLLISQGLKWLPANEGKPGWAIVLVKLIEFVPSGKERDLLISQGLKWLLANKDKPGWARILVKLIEFVPSSKERDALISLGIKWMSESDGGTEWGCIFANLTQVVTTVSEREALISQGLRWLPDHEDMAIWGSVFEILIDVIPSGKERETLIINGLKWLSLHEGKSGWVHILVKLIEIVPSGEKQEALISQGLKWMPLNDKTGGWQVVFRSLIEIMPRGLERKVLISQGLNWLSQHEDKAGWSDVYNKLIREVNKQEALIPLGLRWLSRNEANVGWNEIFNVLIEVLPLGKEREVLIARGLKWLSQYDKKVGWTSVYNKVIGVVPSGSKQKALISQGLKWLDQNEDKVGWNEVFNKIAGIVSQHKDHDALFKQGLKWLSRHEHTTGWTEVLNKLISIALSSKEREPLIAMGLRWLSQHDEKAGWSELFNKLIGIASSNDERDALITQGLKWVRKHEHNVGWNRLFTKLLEVVLPGKEYAALVSLGIRWLSEHEDKGGWPRVWQRLIDAAPLGEEREVLISQGLTWVHKHESKAGWGYIFVALIEVLPPGIEREELIARGLKWLSQRDNNKTEWAQVLGNLIEVMPPNKEREALISQGMKWASLHQSKTMWGQIFVNLIDVVPPDEEHRTLVEQGLKWVCDHDHHMAWPFVFRKLIEVAPSGKERETLIALGLKWMPTREHKVGWGYVTAKLIELSSSDKERDVLITKGKKWVSLNKNKTEWRHVLKTLIDAYTFGKEPNASLEPSRSS